MSALLTVKHLSRTYQVKRAAGWFAPKQTLHAVDDISFEIAPGRTLGLVGESGCGKSTTAKLVLGLIPSTKGQIIFEGQEQSNDKSPQWRKDRQHMQMVYQDPLGALDRRLKVIDQVIEPLVIQNMHEPHTRRTIAEDMMLSVGLTENLFERYPHELSGGQRQRVVLARALILKPSLLVCDEPTSALDVSIQAQVINLLQDIQKQMNLAMLFISHDLKIVKHICDDVAVMYLGRIIEQGPVQTVFGSPAHPYTQALLSAVSSPWKHGAAQKRIILKGEPPNPLNRPTGCAFHPRCAAVVDLCRNEAPALKQTSGEHRVSCHRSGINTELAVFSDNTRSVIMEGQPC